MVGQRANIECNTDPWTVQERDTGVGAGRGYPGEKATVLKQMAQEGLSEQIFASVESAGHVNHQESRPSRQRTLQVPRPWEATKVMGEMDLRGDDEVSGYVEFTGWWSDGAHRDGKLLEGSEQAVLQSQSRQGQGRQQGWPGPSMSWEAVMETFIRVEVVSECWTPGRLCQEGLGAEHEKKRGLPPPRPRSLHSLF